MSTDKKKSSWIYSDNEFIKLYRKMLEWKWYTDVNTKVLFIHCLLKANWKDGTWHGYKYKRGQFITSLTSLAEDTGLTVQKVRTAIKHLKSTGEITDWHDNKIRIITVNSFNKYQNINRQPNSQSTGNQQATNSQSTTDIRIHKNNKENKEINKPSAEKPEEDVEDNDIPWWEKEDAK